MNKGYIYKKVDAFTGNGSKGNPAAFMILGDEHFSNEQFLDIASAHKGFISEFVFVQNSNVADLKLTYYSSECEVDFCGHGTIATMYELIKDDPKLFAKERIQIETNKKGILTVYNHIKDEDAIYISAPKAKVYDVNVEPAEVAKALGTTVDVISQEYPMAIIDAGLKTFIVPISSLQDEITILPNIDVLKEFAINSDIDIILLFSKETSDDNYYAHTRVFPQKYGYLEDPATGSGNSAFANYLLMNHYWDGMPIAVEQGNKNMIFNAVRLRAENGDVLFGGTAKVKISGMYYT